MTRLKWILLFLVAAKFVFHTIYVPAFEGPDEPFHLAHVGRIWRADVVPPDIVGSVQQHPCSIDLRRAFGCQPFGGGRAEFDVLHATSPIAAKAITNYEAHQPPLYYAVAALFAHGDPVTRLLLIRLFSVVICVAAIVLFLRDDVTEGALLVLLLPGAAESLARCANDPGVFAWCAAMIWAVRRNAPTYALALLALAGPLVKLTAIPVIAFVVIWAIRNRGLVQAAAIAVAAMFVLPVQWFRGYLWGGTVELNARTALDPDTITQALIGFIRSAYTFIKTVFWLGEWSFFRAPAWLLAIALLYVIVVVISVRLRPGAWAPHATALAVAAIGTAIFFVSHRRFWGQWGGVGGWYAWGWYPWLIVAARDSFELRRVSFLRISGAILIVVANVAWFATAHSIYG